ncbi:helix-turn-helix transcriptional regulator [Candidatus Dojkabacteria bacterium]|nr:helix-turn-helix transcriptional regulator [Candidatus Dojkabacteria bacterium]
MFRNEEKNLIRPDPEEISSKLLELAFKIKRIRHEHTITVRELSEITGISSRTIWRLENGKTVKLESLIKMLYVFGCDLRIEN